MLGQRKRPSPSQQGRTLSSSSRDDDDDESKVRRPSTLGWTASARLARFLWPWKHRAATSTTALPMTMTTTTVSSDKPMRLQQPHNQYLFGGAYYPDKSKSYHHRRKSQQHRRRLYKYCWHYTKLCSLPVIILWLLLWLYSRRGRQPSQSIEWPSQFHRMPPLHSSSSLLSQLSLPTLADERARAQQRAKERQFLVESVYKAKRLAILERIAPKWMHRNDKPVDEDNTSRKHEPLSKTEAIAPTTSKIVLVPNQQPNQRVLRTLATMHDASLYPSRCPHETTTTTTLQTTLVIQSSFDRLWILQETCRRWSDFMIVVVAVASEEQQAQAVTMATHCPRLTLVVYRLTDDELAHPDQYPVNYLRNLGLEQVQTSHVLVVDVDFVPSMGLASRIHEALTADRESVAHDEAPLALVVPAFERVMNCSGSTDHENHHCQHLLQTNSSFLPETFEALQHCVESKDCRVFQSTNNRDGHGSTRSQEWLQRQWYDDNNDKDKAQQHRARRISCFESLRYEPYVVIEWCLPPATTTESVRTVPFYDERFHGYGKNKIQHVQHLRLLGYQFGVLPQGFLIHNPHADSLVKETWNNRTASDLHASMDALYPAFLHELLDVLTRNNAHEKKSYTIVEQCKRQRQSKL